MAKKTSDSKPNRNYSHHPLSKEQKKEILCLIHVGCSRRTAALAVGCTPNAVDHLAQRDAEFEKRLSEAEESFALKALENTRKAATDPRYSEAKAWLLERDLLEDSSPLPANRASRSTRPSSKSRPKH